MKIENNEDNILTLKEVFSGVMLETAEGNRIGVCMRDDTLEINILPKGKSNGNWWRVDMQSEVIFHIGKDEPENLKDNNNE